jgi:hypothetical protein
VSALSVYDLNSLEMADTTWHIPAVAGVIVGGIATHLWLTYNKRARRGGGEIEGLSGYRRRGRRRSSRGRRCMRFKSTRAGRRCARFA